MPQPDLSTAPKYLRSTPARGISTDNAKPIDRTGGRYGAGIIRGVSVITVGEALGHDMWVDETMLEQVAEHINRYNKGIKSRYTHPSLSGDGLGRHVARLSDAYVDGDQVFADQHFLASAHDTPEGDLAGYLLTLADEDPEAYGLSIVFRHDQAAMDEFTALNSQGGQFQSPDPRNVNNYVHARVAEVRAADAVDEPAANPAGLFSKEQGIAEEADQLAAYALGLSDTKPELVSLDIDPDRIRGFASRFLHSHALEVKPMAKQLNEEKPVDEVVEQPTPAEAATDAPSDEPEEATATETAETAEPVAASTGGSESSRAEFARFREAFGDHAGDYFAAGLSFEAAQARHVVLLAEENAALKQQLEALGQAGGERSPIDLEPERSTNKGGGFASKIRIK